MVTHRKGKSPRAAGAESGILTPPVCLKLTHSLLMRPLRPPFTEKDHSVFLDQLICY